MKKSLIEATEAAAAASRNFPYTCFVVLDRAKARSRFTTAYMAYEWTSAGYEVVKIFFRGREVPALYEIASYDNHSRVYGRYGSNIGEMVIEADLMSVPEGGHIQIIDEISGKRIYYRERD